LTELAESALMTEKLPITKLKASTSNLEKNRHSHTLS